MSRSPPHYAADQGSAPSPAHVVDALLRVAAAKSTTVAESSLGHSEQVRGPHEHRRQGGDRRHMDGSDPVWEHYQNTQRPGHVSERYDGGYRKGKGKGTYSSHAPNNRRSSGGSPGNSWNEGKNANRGRKGSGRGHYSNNNNSSYYKTYSPLVVGSSGGGVADLADRENVPVTDEEWGEDALILTPDSPPSVPLADDKHEKEGKLPRVPEHAPAPQLAASSTSSTATAPLLPTSDFQESLSVGDQQSDQLDVDPEVLRMTLEALGVGPATTSSTVAETPPTTHETSGHEDFVNPDLPPPSDDTGVTAADGGPRLRVDKDAAMRIICHYAGLRRPRKPTSPPPDNI